VAAERLSAHPRAEAMARRLTVTAWRAGVSEPGARALERSFLAAIDMRAAVIADPEHHTFLHPARTALILLDDAGVTDAAALAASPLVESFEHALRPSAAALASILDERAGALFAEVPLPPCRPDGDADALLLEQLVTAGRAACLVALAEQLDQARHLHLRMRGHAPVSAADAAVFLRRATAVYLPVAARTHPRLAARLDRWAGAFARRFPGAVP
jgi:hypothetical protein